MAVERERQGGATGGGSRQFAYIGSGRRRSADSGQLYHFGTQRSKALRQCLPGGL